MVDQIRQVFERCSARGAIGSSQHERPRAQRFDIQLSLSYRACGETAWLKGRTENMSYTGVLFRAEQFLKANTGVEMNFEVPVEIGGEIGAEVVCHGEIVRTVGSVPTDPRPSLAARILEYRFVRGRRKSAP